MMCILVSTFPLDCQLKETKEMGQELTDTFKKTSPLCM